MRFMSCQSHCSSSCFRQKQAGVSLIIVLMMLVIIGLTSASAIKSAFSGEKVTNNIRMQNLAQQYAEAALRYCETELGKADASRVATLREATIDVTTLLGAAGAWELGATWIGASGAWKTRTTLPEAQIKSTDSAFKPTTLPQCVVERQVIDAVPNTAYVITARGFSPDYTADAGTGKTTNGSVVWLQSTVRLN